MNDPQRKQSAAETEPVIGTGRVISPEELERQLAIISTRDDAHRIVSIAAGPPQRFVY